MTRGGITRRDVTGSGVTGSGVTARGTTARGTAARGTAARGTAALLMSLAALAAQQPAAPLLEPVQRWPLQTAAVAPRWLDDVVAVRSMLPPEAGTASLDLTDRAVLLVPAALPEGQRLVWHRARLQDGEWRAELRAEPVPAGAADPRELGALFLLPRVTEPVRVHVPVAAGPPLPLLQLDKERGQRERIPILAVRELADVGGERARCERASTPAEWRRMCRALGPAGRVLPADLVDFDRHCVVLVAPARAAAVPGLALAVATEEDVDVVTVGQRLPSGRALDEIGPALLLTLPRRAHALSVVLRLGTGLAPAGESTLGTFAPLR